MNQDEIVFLDIFREEDRIKVSVQDEAGLETQTLHHYEHKVIDWDHLYRDCAELFQVMNAYNQDGRLAERSLRELRRLGGVLMDELFPPDTKEQLFASRAQNMVIRIENGLVQVPWELLHDGEQFFCRRWNMGRLVRTHQKVYKTSHRELRLPLSMILIADPRGDLPAAYKEGVLVRDMLDAESEKIGADLISHCVEARTVKGLFKDYDIFHYAGHADFVSQEPSQSGLLLKDGKVTAGEIIGMSGGRGVPSLVFVNGCRSGQTEEWSRLSAGSGQGIFGLANAFLVAGTRHYVGTFREVQDKLSSRFAERFYTELLAGQAVGRCIRQAREEIIQDAGEDAIVWATYMLYGDPTYTYAQERPRAERAEEEKEMPPSIGLSRDWTERNEFRLRGNGTEVFSPEADSPGSGTRQPVRPRTRISLSVMTAVCVLLLGVAMFGVYVFSYQRGVRETAVLLAGAREALYDQGDLEKALGSYEKALESGKAAKGQLADLHGRLGRGYAQRGEMAVAVQHYEAALAIAPDDLTTQGNLCVALNRTGQYEAAGRCTQNLLSAAPQDTIALSLHQALEEKVAGENERTRREHVRSLVDRLSERSEAPGEVAAHTKEDEWTSRPMTLALLGLEDRGGLSVRDGQTDTLWQTILSGLSESSRLTVVDRSLMEALLEELDLGSGKLANPAFSLRLGKILATRLMGQGNVFRDKDSLQVNLRFIETETSSLKMALSRSFPRDTSIQKIGALLSDDILHKVQESYPLQGKVLSAGESEDIVVNLGKRMGLSTDAVLGVLPPQGSDPRLAFARLRVISVQTDTARAEVLSKSAPVIGGCRVLESAEARK